MVNVKEIIDLLGPISKEETGLIEKAYAFAERVHVDQKRNSGEPYFNHVFEAAKILASLGMDAKTVAAGFLHDTIEDNLIKDEELQKEFGKEILFLVKGVTKLEKLEYHGAKRHIESLRKFFIATAEDVRVLIIRLADRLHNVKTLEHVREDKRRRVALETLEIFAPLADRLGMNKLRGELEDYSFPHIYPKEYEETRELLRQKTKASEKYLEKIKRTLQKKMAEAGVKTAKIDYRIKRLYSLYKKLVRKEMNIDKVYDVVALRVIVKSVEDCYKALGIIHSLWRPLPGRIKDYIALPKLNGYQSIHTTIFTGNGEIVEIQIRTEQMQKEAEYGITSHISYKDGKKIMKQLPWINQTLEWQKHVSESGEFMENLKMDFFNDRVFVFTPLGDVIDLPEGSGPIDFAYAIHTDIGGHVSGAKVNNKMVPLDVKLKNGDIVEIITKEGSHPTEKWLNYAKTPLAKKNIRSIVQSKSSKLKSFLQNIGRRPGQN